MSAPETDRFSTRQCWAVAAQLAQRLADVAAVGAGGAEALRGGVAEHDPHGPAVRVGEDPLIVDPPLVSERAAVRAWRSRRRSSGRTGRRAGR